MKHPQFHTQLSNPESDPMTVILETLRTYKTRNFEVKVCALPEDEPFNHERLLDGPKIAEMIEKGELVHFCGAVLIYSRGQLIGSGFIGECLYSTYDQFMESGYLREIMGDATREARQFLHTLPKVRKPRKIIGY